MVLGMHRGGTSTIARSLKAIGVELGDHLVTPHASDNPRGYWEDYEVYGLSERLLGAIGLRWDSLEDFTLAPWQSDTVAVLRNEAEQLLRQRLGAWHSWGFKDPRTARLLDFWQPVFQRVGTPVQYVIAVRNPLSVSRSLAKRDGFETEKSLLLWLLHMFPATVKTADEFTVFVDYDLLLDRPREQVERIREKLGLPQPASDGALLVEFERDFLAQELRHTRFSESDLRIDRAVPRLAIRAYESLIAACRDDRGLTRDELRSEWRDIVDRINEFAPFLALAERLDQKVRSRASGSNVAELNAHIRELTNANTRQATELEAAAEQIRVSAEVAELNARIRELTNANTRQATELEAAAEQIRLSDAAHSAEVAELNGRIHELTNASAHQADQLASEKQRYALLSAELHAVLGSRSWRITAPLRRASALRSRMFRRKPRELVHSTDDPKAGPGRRNPEAPPKGFLTASAETVAAILADGRAVWRLSGRAEGLGQPLLERYSRVPRPLLRTASVFRAVARRSGRIREIHVVVRSGYFDHDYYLTQCPDVRSLGVDPLIHYVMHGASEGRNPNPWFDSAWYLLEHPDVAASGINPLAHFVRFGAREGRRPSQGNGFPERFRAADGKGAHRSGASNPAPVADAPTARANVNAGVVNADRRVRRDAEKWAYAISARSIVESLKHRPMISVVLPAYNTPEGLLHKAVHSVVTQLYPDWELCIVDDGSGQATKDAIRELARLDPRIRFVLNSENKGISRASNQGLEMARGDFVAFLDHDDELTPNALMEVVSALNRDHDLDAIYTDQDYIDADGNVDEPLVKPDWAPLMFCGVMYVGHLLVVRRSLALEVGGFDPVYDNVQDFEFMLRVSERSTRIRHISSILYHWRRIPGSVAFHGNAKPDIDRLQAQAVTRHLERVGFRAEAIPNPRHAHRAILRPAPGNDSATVTAFIWGRGDAARTTERALRAMVGRVPDNVELIDPANPLRLDTIDTREPRENDYLLFIQAGLVPSTENWLEHMLVCAEHPSVGAVAPLVTDGHGKVTESGLILSPEAGVAPAMQGFDVTADGYAGSLSVAREVTAVSGLCVLIKRQRLAELEPNAAYVGPYFLWADLAMVATGKGFTNIVTPFAIAELRAGKVESASENELDRMVFTDRWREEIRAGDRYHNRHLDPLDGGFRPRISLTDPAAGAERGSELIAMACR